ncbi:MAG: N-acetylmuramoyl-L-alanine amidase [Pseudomonadota bacterium]
MTKPDHPGARWHPSPNFGERRGGARPSLIVIHYTAMESAAAAIDRLCDPAAEVSAHYVIAKDGAITQLVAEGARAWHAGAGAWAGLEDVNSHAIGIELDHLGLDADGLAIPFAAPQMAALEELLAGAMARHAIRPAGVIGHACLAPSRKQDPGPAFDWRGLALKGLSVWLDQPREAATPHDGADPAVEAAFLRAAATLGCPVPAEGTWGAAQTALWRAFAARFMPTLYALPGPTARAAAHATALAAAFPAMRPQRA